MRAATRAFDWSRTPVGPMATWSNNQRNIVNLVVNSRHPMFLWWGPELVQFYNDAYRPSLGDDHVLTALGARGREFWADIWPIIGPQVDAVMQRGESSWHEDHLVPITRNGRVEEVYWTYGYSPVWDDNGQIGGTLVVVQEQTARVLAARRVRTVRDVASMASLHHAQADAWLAGFDVLGANPSDLPWVMGFAVADDGTSARLVGQRPLDVVDEARLRQAFPLEPGSAFRRVVDSGKPEVLDDLRSLVGDIVVPPWHEPVVSARLIPIRRSRSSLPYGILVVGLSPRLPFDEEYADFLTMAADQLASAITNAHAHEEEQRHVEALAQLSVRLEFTLDAAGVGYWDLDLRTRRASASLRHHQIFGYADMAQGWTLDAFMSHVVPEHRAGVEMAVNASIRTLDDLDVECRIETAGGVYRWIHMHARVEGSHGLAVRMLGIVHDVSERRDLLAREQEARKAAEQASHAKDQFLATLSHELRTPMNTIIGWTDLLAEGGLDPGEAQVGLATVQRHAQAQARIIDDLLDMGRIVSGKIHIDPRIVPIEQVVRDAVESVSHAATAKGVRLVSGPLTDRRLVAGDVALLQQIFWNLMGNAVKFTPAGGTVTVSIDRVGAGIEVTVRDSGEGIDSDFLPHVFDRFRQADGTSTRSHGGLGLGLSIVKQLVEAHGGAVRGASAGPGRGAAFTVCLPMAEASGAPPAGLGSGATLEARLHGARILLVDDDEDSRYLIARILKGRQATVVTAASAAEAMGALHQQSFDLLVSDIGMPHEDGYELIRKVRSLQGARGGTIPALALTAYGRPEDRTRALAAGFQEHETKPVQAARLLRACASLIRTAPTG